MENHTRLPRISAALFSCVIGMPETDLKGRNLSLGMRAFQIHDHCCHASKEYPENINEKSNPSSEG
ncbi:hypothetical protein [Paenibacillus ferrarius]|uniref:hypothetical protein n=1 Tax=Paenibacillus ferrarius TaxID=1469647 RepID=UPI00118068FA|nr:hypothetical protein [Paenibacillus ferrarius]